MVAQGWGSWECLKLGSPRPVPKPYSEQSWDPCEAAGLFLARGWMQTALALIKEIITKMHLNHWRSGGEAGESLVWTGPAGFTKTLSSSVLKALGTSICSQPPGC